MYNTEQRMQEIMEVQQLTAVEKSKLYSDQLNRFLVFKNKWVSWILLTKFVKQNEEIRQEIHNRREVSEPLQKYVQQATGFEYVNNPAQQQPQRRTTLSDKETFLSRSARIQYDQQRTKRHRRYRNTQKCPCWTQKQKQ